MHTLVVVIGKARAARSLAEGSKKAKHIFYTRVFLHRNAALITLLTKRAIVISELELSAMMCASYEFPYIFIFTVIEEPKPQRIGYR